nr:hypothetical protein [Tanacetum cinerariifolium]GEY11619.1 hypothetical protein [Tanacetum cinerariifolium]
MDIEEGKELATLSLDKLIAIKAKVTWDQTSDDSDSQGGSDEDVDEEEETKALICWLKTFVSSFARITGLDAEKPAIIDLEIKEDINLKFLRSLPSEWKTHTLIWRNKADLEEQILDDLFNNLKIYEAEVKGSSPSIQNIQNIAFVSSNNTDSIYESVTAPSSIFAASSKAKISTLLNVDSVSDALIYSFFASQSNSPQLDNEDLKKINLDDLKEMDLKWKMAMLTMRAKRFLKITKRNLGANGTDTIRGIYFKCLVSWYDAVGGYDWSFQVDEDLTNYALITYTSSGSSSSSG